MPGRDITRRSNSALRILFLLAFVVSCASYVGTAAQACPERSRRGCPVEQSSTALSQDQSPTPKPQDPTPKTQDQQPQAPASAKPEDQGIFVFKKDVDEVLLHASVVDASKHIVTDLDRGAFTVFEDGKQQSILSFHNEDIPVAMGVVIDNSGSMREKRAKVNQAALNLVRASNPRDEVFIVNFNDEYYLDQDFTNDLLKLKEALDKIDTRGGTALYDAVVASAEHLKRNARLDKKILFVVTDGEDNTSNENLEQAVKQLQEENGPQVYAIGILGDEEHPKRARRALEIIAQRTGGLAFFPKTLDEVDAISKEVAHDIRTQYTIGYKPTNPKTTGGFRQIRVEAKAKGHKKMVVRTKSGYYAGATPANSGGK